MDSVGSEQTHITDSWEYGNDCFWFQTPRDCPWYLREYHYKKDPLIQIFRTHQHITNSAMLQRARNLKRELQRRIREKRTAQKRRQKKYCEGRSFVDRSHIT